MIERKTSPTFTKEQFKTTLLNFRKIDASTKEDKAKLIDTFVGRIYVFDDHIKIVYNIDGKDEEFTLDELESPNSPQCGQPPRRNTTYFEALAYRRRLNFYVDFHNSFYVNGERTW